MNQHEFRRLFGIFSCKIAAKFACIFIFRLTTTPAVSCISQPPQLIRHITARHDNIDVVMSSSAVVENVGIAAEVMSVCRWKLKLHRPAEKLRFFHVGCPWFSRSLQVLEQTTFKRKSPIRPELEITFERQKIATRFHTLPHIFDHARL